MPNQRNGCAQFAAGKLPEIQLACRPSSAHLPVHPSPPSHTFWPRSLVCLTFQFVGPVRKKRRKEEKQQQQQAQLLGQSQRQLGPQFPFGFAFMSCSSSCSLLPHYSPAVLLQATAQPFIILLSAPSAVRLRLPHTSRVESGAFTF